MKNIKHTTADGIVIYRMARKHRGKVFYSKAWLLIRWEFRKAFYFGLGRNLNTAAKRAKEIDTLIGSERMSMAKVQELYPGRRLKRAVKPGYATIGKLMDVVVEDAVVLELDSTTARSYASSLIKVVREALNVESKIPVTTEQVREKSAEILTEATFTAFKRVRGARAKELNDMLKEASALRSANKDIRQAKAALSDEAQKRFAERHLRVPDFKSWRDVPQFGGLQQKYRLPAVAIVRGVMGKVDALDAGSELWKVCMLAAHAGMRRREIAFARWEWFAPGNTPRIEVRRESDFTPKGNHERSIEVASWAFAALKTRQTNGETYVLSGNKDERLRAVDKLAVGFLRKAGIKADKPVHELRKWFGTWVAATRGLTVAQRQLGHDSYATTEEYYRDISFPEEELGFFWKR